MTDKEDELRGRLEEAEATLEAIRTGRIDALVVEGGEGHLVYSVETAELPFRLFLEQMAEGAVSLDANRSVLYCNRFFAELIGAPRESLLGADFEELIAPDRRVAFGSALRAEGPQRFGSALSLASGLRVPVALAVTPIGSGQARRYTLVVTDVSERGRLQELSAANEAAEAASMAKDHFLAVLGHELRGPLNVMMGWIGFLLEERERFDPQVQKALEAVQRNARLQRRLIEDMVDVARIRSGKLRLEREIVDLGEVAQATGLAMAVAARARRIELDVQSCSGAFVLGDAQRLEQMLQNLIGNAIKFTPEGGRVTLRVELRPAVTRLTVGDTGRGIDPALQTLIFQPFRQGVPESGQHDTGLGLGLAITKAVVELHGGHISVSSAGVDRGSEFCVELPAVGAPDEAAAERALPAIDGTLSGVRILVVDDEEQVRENTARVLARAGAEVVCVSGAESALARLEDQPFDIVVSDLMMPGTDGWELARRVRERYESLPIVALSGIAGSLASGRAEASGFLALLKKPVDEHELVSRIRPLLRRA